MMIDQAASRAGEASPPSEPGHSSTPEPLWEEWASLWPKDPRRRQWLAEARRGAGKRAGTVPAMWPLYRASNDAHGGTADMIFEAEHICLVLFGFHQQSKDVAVHTGKAAFPTALQRLRESPRFHDREKALDAKVFAAATSTTLDELQQHLRSLIALLKTEDLGFDYTRLLADLTTWQLAGGADQVRRQWGRAYYQRRKATTTAASPSTTKGAIQ